MAAPSRPRRRQRLHVLVLPGGCSDDDSTDGYGCADASTGACTEGGGSDNDCCATCGNGGCASGYTYVGQINGLQGSHPTGIRAAMCTAETHAASRMTTICTTTAYYWDGYSDLSSHDSSKCREYDCDSLDGDCCGYDYETWCADGYTLVRGNGGDELLAGAEGEVSLPAFI